MEGVCGETVTPTFVLPVLCFLLVVQRVDSVSEGIANYGGKIIAVETDLKKLGKFLVSDFTVEKKPKQTFTQISVLR